MSDFKPIETQEQFDAAISERLKRDRESYAKKFEGYTSPEELQAIKDDYAKQIKTLEDAAATTQETIAQKDAQIAEGAKYKTDLEKTRIALAAGLRMEYADRLKGETAEEWKEDAETLAKDFAAAHKTAPLGSSDPTITKEQNTKDRLQDWLNENF